jgi:protein ImuA
MSHFSLEDHWPTGLVWRASDGERAGTLLTQATGHATLDEVLPGGGWPVGELVEVLQVQPVGADWQLVMPALVQRQQQSLREGHAAWAGSVVLINPVHPPFTPAWEDAGLDTSRVVWLHPPQPQACAWAAEQALQCADVVAVMAWLPHATAPVLRRLQHMAAQSRCLLWVFRPASCAVQASPAPLRLEVSVSSAESSAVPALDVRVLKRRGLPCTGVVTLPWVCSQVPQALQAQREFSARRRSSAQEYRHEPTPLDGVGSATVAA